MIPLSRQRGRHRATPGESRPSATAVVERTEGTPGLALSTEPAPDLEITTEPKVSLVKREPTGGPAKVGKRSKKSRKKKGAKAKANATGPTGQLGSAKAVETMFRNAIRSELDMITLAATKANIMISLNGFIISALMISGAFLFNSSPMFLIPAAVFMLTSAGSIVFALFAASPDELSLKDSVRNWWGKIRRRPAETENHEDNLLIYEDRVKLGPDAYWDEMQELLQDRDEIYHKMSGHLYWLGQMASRKFKNLNVSYVIFRWGLLASILTFLLVKGTTWAVPLITGPKTTPMAATGIAEFTDIFEPSAVQQLPDGRILVVEDEPARAMNLLTIGDDGRLVEDSAADLKLTRSFGRPLNDLEGLSIDGDDIYAITSHSSDSDGKRDSGREQVLRFQIKGTQAGQVATYSGLRNALTASVALRSEWVSMTGKAPDFSKLNIEGLAFHRDHLMLGLRDPKASGRSVVVPIENPDEMFEGRTPRFGKPILLDLAGGGIRALSYDPVLGAFLIVNEIENESGDKQSQMWRWSGDAAVAPEPLTLPNLINLNNVESIDSVKIGGADRLLIMADDGDPKENIPAKYMILDYDQLPPQAAPVASEPVVPAPGASGAATSN